MQAKDAIKQVIEFSHLLVRMYVEDLGDQDLLVRSVPGANHIAWQLGHAAAGTAYMLGMLGHPPQTRQAAVVLNRLGHATAKEARRSRRRNS